MKVDDAASKVDGLAKLVEPFVYEIQTHATCKCIRSMCTHISVSDIVTSTTRSAVSATSSGKSILVGQSSAKSFPIKRLSAMKRLCIILKLLICTATKFMPFDELLLMSVLGTDSMQQ